ncbi:solute carrier family 2, facilitated glucose transporter member 12 [Lepisosteus oculatus]|uniref:Solute carrier family 2, facilitated glucose transporter member 12 n=1 Tax=Lepisosteus oculatus TaxID=7918 RepID=W5NHA1_LEPOC|nr:PREDICTED: solute carrier family 2, facilitated glucose transporter member 12 [Lepisosteus oculatus]XP_015204264.1 PREDICTED: solute carrier family 2, facilitated glucose transporter member 12 [Lepisosteus oculatus]
MDLDGTVTGNYKYWTFTKDQTLEISPEKNVETEKSGCGNFIFLASVIAAISGFMLGYEMGVVSGVLLQLRDILSLTCQEQEMVVSSLLFGALLLSLGGGFLLDQHGRKFSIIVTTFLVVIGTLLMICVVSYTALIIGRIMVGMAVALSGIASCLYIAEIAPQNKRGLLVSLYELMVVIGVLTSFVFSYVFASVSDGWKYMFGIVIPPAVLQAGTMCFLPVSPRFLVKKGQSEAARAVLKRLRASSAVEEELQSIQTILEEESRYTFSDLFRSKDNIRTRLLIGVALVFFQQVTGQPNVLFYAATIFKSVGFHSNEAATLASAGMGAVKVACTIPAVMFVDRVGSKTFLSIGAVLMTISLTTLGVVTLKSHTNVTSVCDSHSSLNQTHWVHNSTAGFAVHGVSFLNKALNSSSDLSNTVNLTTSSKRLLMDDEWNITNPVKGPNPGLFSTKVSSTLKWLSLVSLLVYIAAFSISLGPMVWVVLSEIFPMGIRGKAMSAASVINWGINLIISMTFLTITEKTGLPNVIFMYAVMSFALLVFVILYIPETKGLSLEEISMELARKNHSEDCICYRIMPKTGILKIKCNK